MYVNINKKKLWINGKIIDGKKEHRWIIEVEHT